VKDHSSKDVKQLGDVKQLKAPTRNVKLSVEMVEQLWDVKKKKT
jgi:hypothetical protein